MALPTVHTIRTIQLHTMKYDPSIYKNIGTPPKYHVICSCQWEGWTHDKRGAEYFVASHSHAQTMRGNIIEIVPFVELAEPSSSPVQPSIKKPSMADVQPVPCLNLDVSQGYPDPIGHAAEVAKELHDKLGVDTVVDGGIPVVVVPSLQSSSAALSSPLSSLSPDNDCASALKGLEVEENRGQ